MLFGRDSVKWIVATKEGSCLSDTLAVSAYLGKYRKAKPNQFCCIWGIFYELILKIILHLIFWTWGARERWFFSDFSRVIHRVSDFNVESSLPIDHFMISTCNFWFWTSNFESSSMNMNFWWIENCELISTSFLNWFSPLTSKYFEYHNFVLILNFTSNFLERDFDSFWFWFSKLIKLVLLFL